MRFIIPDYGKELANRDEIPAAPGSVPFTLTIHSSFLPPASPYMHPLILQGFRGCGWSERYLVAKAKYRLFCRTPERQLSNASNVLVLPCWTYHAFALFRVTFSCLPPGMEGLASLPAGKPDLHNLGVVMHIQLQWLHSPLFIVSTVFLELIRVHLCITKQNSLACFPIAFIKLWLEHHCPRSEKPASACL